MEALEQRIGGEFWIHAPNGGAAEFLTEPNPGAPTFRPTDNQSFEITDIAGKQGKTLYYQVKFASGKTGYLRPERFHEELNLTIVHSDPLAQQKVNTEQKAAEEKQRVAWIKAQPWPATLKDAAIKNQPQPGLTSAEVIQIMGQPRRITRPSSLMKTRAQLKTQDERWFYPDGAVLLFRSGILNQVTGPTP
ncbi:MAG: hypothetical protein EXR70_14505 [Deltaproteobacteria bacterium]|nr:hypothetical protein [Deltaproteobacteria bacterium]